MAGNKTLGKAKMQKKDEFYTQLSDIENELRHYKQHFKDKIIFCNCDDPYESNFFKYFALNFNVLGIKKLIATCYATSPVTGQELEYYVDNGGQLSFIQPVNTTQVQAESERKPYKVEITEVTDENGDGRIDLADVEYLMRNKKNTMALLEGDGDFRSSECVKLLKEADIVVTNPPFSLFREYVAQLVEYEKNFIIIGNQNAIHYKEIFPLIQNNKMWLGYGFANGNAYFSVPNGIDTSTYAKGVYDKTTKLVKFRNCMWFTNIDIDKRHENMILFRNYNPEVYPTYENYDAIEVGKTSDIPCDYYGNMGVPDTFLQSYNPEQFEIVGYGRGDFLPDIGCVPADFLQDYRNHGGKGHITTGMKSLCYYDTDKIPKFPYSRIIVRRREQQQNENQTV